MTRYAVAALTLALFLLPLRTAAVTGPDDLPNLSPRVLRWLSDEDPGNVLRWEWQEVGAPPDSWIHIVAFERREHLWAGIIWLPPGMELCLYARAVSVTGSVTVPSNQICTPNCWDVDANHDGIVGGTEFLLMVGHQVCTVTRP